MMDNAPGPIRAGVLNEALRNFAFLAMAYRKCTLKFGGLPVYLFNFDITRIPVAITKYRYIAKVL